MTVCADPVLEALGLAESDITGSFSQSPIASSGNAFTLASIGYPPDPFAANWPAYLQAASIAATAASLTGQLSCSQGFTQIGSEENLQSTMPSTILMPSTLPSLATESQEQAESNSTELMESPLVLPDVLPAESRHSASSSGNLSDNVIADRHEGFLWSAVVPALPSGAWPGAPCAPWLPADLSGNDFTVTDFSAASNLAHIYNSLGTDTPTFVPGESAFIPNNISADRDYDSPAPSTPPGGTGGGATEQTPVKLNLSEAIHRSRAELETPPKTQRWAFRADAPCFVPKDTCVSQNLETIFAKGISLQQSLEGSVQEITYSDDKLFLEWREKMLRFKPKHDSEIQTGDGMLRTVAASSISNILFAAPPSEVESELDKVEVHTHASGKGSGNGDTKRGGKAESRGYIRALAADARAQLASPAEISRKDVKSGTVHSSVSRRGQYRR